MNRTKILDINNFEFLIALIYYMIVSHCLVKTQYFTLSKEKLNYLTIYLHEITNVYNNPAA